MKKIYQTPELERVAMSDVEHLLKGSTDEVFSKEIGLEQDDDDGWDGRINGNLWDE